LNNVLELLLLFLVLCGVGFLVGLEPLYGRVDRLLHLGLVVVRELRAQLLLVLQLVLQAVRVGLELVAGLNPLLYLLVVVRKLLGVLIVTIETVS
jgi:hypothetical protein